MKGFCHLFRRGSAAWSMVAEIKNKCSLSFVDGIQDGMVEGWNREQNKEITGEGDRDRNKNKNKNKVTIVI